MVMIAPVKPRQQDFPLIRLGIEDLIPVHIGIDKKVGWLRDHNHVIKNSHAEG